jgi:hypothetical protein
MRASGEQPMSMYCMPHSSIHPAAAGSRVSVLALVSSVCVSMVRADEAEVAAAGAACVRPGARPVTGWPLLEKGE